MPNYKYQINEMTCSGCLAKVTKALSAFDNNVSVRLQPPQAILNTAKKIVLADLQRALSAVGPYTIQELIFDNNNQFTLSPLATDAISNAYQNDLPNHILNQQGKYYCPMLCEGDKVYDKNIGCPICGMDLVKIGNDGNSADEAIALKKMLLHSLFFTIPLFIISMLGMHTHSSIYLYIPMLYLNIFQWFGATAVLYIGRKYLYRAYVSFKNWQLNMFSLIGMGAIAAYLFSVYALFFPHHFHSSNHIPLYFESVAVIFSLMILGQWLEARAHQKTKNNLAYLFDLVPQISTRIEGNEYIETITNQIKIGDTLLIKSGENIPTDGILANDEAWVNERFLTGESQNIQKKRGDKLLAGSINAGNNFEIKSTTTYENSWLYTMINKVSTANMSRAPIQKKVDKIAGYFVPIVQIIAIITFVYWGFMASTPSPLFAFQNAIAVLVIACPCALGLATPVSISIGIGMAAKHGIFIKNAEVFDRLAQFDVVVTDKTGTLTQGEPMITEVIVFNPFSTDEVIKKGAQLNALNHHPLAKSFRELAIRHNIEIIPTKMVVNIPGKGIQGLINQKKYFLGNEKLMQSADIVINPALKEIIHELQKQGKTILFLAENTQLAGYFVVEDSLKSGVMDTIHYLQALGKEVIIATGDNLDTARYIAKQLNINNVYADMMPEDKSKLIDDLEKNGRKVLMIGDGINDAAALAKAHISIAMETGTDLAKDHSDITLFGGNFNLIKKAMILAEKVKQNIWQNLFFAFIYNIVGIGLASGALYFIFHQFMSPMVGALAMSFSSVSVITNALRLRQLKL